MLSLLLRNSPFVIERYEVLALWYLNWLNKHQSCLRPAKLHEQNEGEQPQVRETHTDTQRTISSRGNHEPDSVLWILQSRGAGLPWRVSVRLQRGGHWRNTRTPSAQVVKRQRGKERVDVGSITGRRERNHSVVSRCPLNVVSAARRSGAVPFSTSVSRPAE